MTRDSIKNIHYQLDEISHRLDKAPRIRHYAIFFAVLVGIPLAALLILPVVPE